MSTLYRYTEDYGYEGATGLALSSDGTLYTWTYADVDSIELDAEETKALYLKMKEFYEEEA